MTKKRTFRLYMYAAAITLAAFSFVSAQKLESIATSGRLSSDKINARIAKLFGQYAVPRAKFDISLTKVLYTPIDEKGKKVVLSRLMATPLGGAPNGLVVFCHGTIQDRDASPSK